MVRQAAVRTRREVEPTNCMHNLRCHLIPLSENCTRRAEKGDHRAASNAMWDLESVHRGRGRTLHDACYAPSLRRIDAFLPHASNQNLHKRIYLRRQLPVSQGQQFTTHTATDSQFVPK